MRRLNEGRNEVCAFSRGSCLAKGGVRAIQRTRRAFPVQDRSSLPPPDGCHTESACSVGISDQEEAALERQEGVCVPFSRLLGGAAAQGPVERADAKRADPPLPRASPRTPSCLPLQQALHILVSTQCLLLETLQMG